MSNMLNVNGSDDPNYRYKMPKVIGKIEGRGNGIKTVVVNASDVAQALHRPTSQVTKFFGCELGAMSRYDPKTDRAVVNGAFETSVLQEMIFKYIEKFVQCGSCGNPETVMEIKGKKKSATIWLNCKACGELTEADNAHKLCTAILKEMVAQPAPTTRKDRKKDKDRKPLEDGEEASMGSASTGTKEKKKKSKKDKKDKKEKKEKKEKKAKKEKSKDKAAPAEESDAEIEDDLGEAAATLETLTIDDAAAIEDAVTKVRALVSASPAPSDEDLVKEVLKFQVNCGLRKVDAVAILFFAAVADQPPASVPKHLGALALLAQSKSLQQEVMSCLEESVARAEDDLKRATAIKIVPLIVKALYDADAVEEEVITSWFKGGFKPEHVRTVVDDATVAAVKAQASPIVTWLETVEEEDDDEEEEEEGDESYDPQSVFGASAPATAGGESDTDSDDSDEE